MIGIIIAIVVFSFFVFKFYSDYYSYDRSMLTFKELVPSLLFLIIIFVSVYVGPDELIELLDDKGYRRRGFYTQVLPLLGLTFAAFPRQVSEISGRTLIFEKYELHKGFRFLGWLMLFWAIVRNVLVLT